MRLVKKENHMGEVYYKCVCSEETEYNVEAELCEVKTCEIPVELGAIADDVRLNKDG